MVTGVRFTVAAAMIEVGSGSSMADIELVTKMDKTLNNWIPITFIKDKYDNYTFTSEMPKDNQIVLITDYYNEVRIETCKIDSYGDLCNLNGDIFGLTAKAWMPLPEPYEAESEE